MGDYLDGLTDGRRKDWFWDYNDIFEADLSVHAKIIRLYLARCADNQSRQSFPSINTIAKKCSVSPATAKRALKELEDKKWIKKTMRKKQSGDYTSNIYTLTYPEEE